MSRPTHWCHGVSVSGPVDPDGCCADQPPTAASLAAELRAEVDRAAADRLAEGLRGEDRCCAECDAAPWGGRTKGLRGERP